VNEKIEPYNVLFEAIENGNSISVKELIRCGVNVNESDPRSVIGNGNTPLHDAANNGHAEIVLLLIEAGADVNARCLDGWTPLIRACNSSHNRIAKLLLKNGADVNSRNKEGYSAWLRTRGKNSELADILRSWGADDAVA